MKKSFFYFLFMFIAITSSAQQIKGLQYLHMGVSQMENFGYRYYINYGNYFKERHTLRYGASYHYYNNTSIDSHIKHVQAEATYEYLLTELKAVTLNVPVLGGIGYVDMHGTGVDGFSKQYNSITFSLASGVNINYVFKRLFQIGFHIKEHITYYSGTYMTFFEVGPHFNINLND